MDMKTFFLFLGLLLCANVAWAQQKPVRIVFDVTSADPSVHQAAIRHVSLMAQSYPGSSYEVVVYGQAIEMVLDSKSSVAKEIATLASGSQVKFAVCELTMKKFNVDKPQLIGGVTSVPDGILEIYSRQQEGWGYIKEGH
jgi:intracellular sulfur oxidation DsrE/DsrF family protein